MVQEAELKFVTAQEAADFLHVTVRGLYKLVKHNKITYYKPGKVLLFLKSDLQQYALSARFQSNSEADFKKACC